MTDRDLPRMISSYRLERLLGRGAMGAVYEATDRRVNTRVAIKLLHGHLVDDDTFRQRFEREAHIGALLHSPYTVQLLDYGFAEGDYYIALEYVDGQNLRQLCARGPLPPQRALKISAQASRALEEAEARRVVHRDIKPENILVFGNDSVKVSDFGISRLAGGASLTAVGSFIGTLSYASPEQQLGHEDNRSDIYSLGATLYFTLAGHPPFAGSTLEILRQHREVPPPLAPLAGLPQRVTDIVARCLEKSPEDRYQSAAELAADLERAAADLSSEEQETHILEGPTEQYESPPAPANTAGEEPPAPETGTAPTHEPTEETEPLRLSAQATEHRHQSAAALSPDESPPASPVLQLSIKEGPRGLFAGTKKYALSVVNVGLVEQQVSLSHQVSQGCQLLMPDRVTVPGGQSAAVEVRVKARKRRWSGRKRPHSFTIFASGGDGGHPPTSIDGWFTDSPLPLLPIGGGVLGISILAIVLIAVLASNEDRPTPGVATATSSSSNTPNGTLPIFGTEPPTAAPTDDFIVAGQWALSLLVTSNSCSFDRATGSSYEVIRVYSEVTPDDGRISAGERVDVFYDDGTRAAATQTFSYPFWQYEGDFASGGDVTFSITFDGPNSGTGEVDERYNEVDGTPCIITDDLSMSPVSATE